MTDLEIINGIKLQGTLLDRRKKGITPAIEDTIRKMYFKDGRKKTHIVRELGISMDTVRRVLDPKVRERDKACALRCTKRRYAELPKEVMYNRRKENYKRHLAYKIKLLKQKKLNEILNKLEEN